MCGCAVWVRYTDGHGALACCAASTDSFLLTPCSACRRKAAELAGHKGKAKAVSAAASLGSSSAAAPIPAAAASDPSKFQKVPKANKGKKGKASKGQKVGNQLLGFSTKSDFSVLERGDDYA